jgi:hypothetical protein
MTWDLNFNEVNCLRKMLVPDWETSIFALGNMCTIAITYPLWSGILNAKVVKEFE